MKKTIRWMPFLAVLATVAWGTGCAKKSAETATSSSTQSESPAATASTAEPQMIRASHILVAYQGAMRATATRTRDEAMARAREALEKVKAPGADFGAIALQYSDDPSVQTGNGDLGPFGKGQMVAEFETAAWKLQVGEISDIVETPFGFHIIKRTA